MPSPSVIAEDTQHLSADDTRDNSISDTRAWFVSVVGLYLLIGLVALLPRLLDLGMFLDSDERNFWMGRSGEFRQAIESGNFADTAISTHPGVTTMWLGSAGDALRQTLLQWGVLESTPFPVLLTFFRLPVVFVHVAGILIGYALLRRMLPVQIATLAALLWAADPFLIAYQRILHVDGLTTTFGILSLLAACAYWHHTRHTGLLVMSGVCAGLAVLSKSPGLALLPAVGLTALVAPDGRQQMNGVSLRLFAARLWPLVVWGAIFALTLVLVWPAVWADPLRVYQLLRLGVEVEGGSPHVIGNFFLGREVDSPGALFYPVALALRTTPFTLLGLLILPLVWRRGAELALTRRDLAVLAGYVLLFVVALSFFPKKINRYIVPAFPAIDILAAAGLVWGIQHLIGHMRRTTQRILVGALMVAAVVNAALWHPYYVVAYNQLLGGAQAGERTFLLGDGEGLAEAAAWLNERPDITGVRILSSMINSFQPYLRHGAQSVSPDGAAMPDRVGYVMLYIRHVQRGGTWPGPPYDQFYHHGTPIYTVTIHGIEYAWIYQVPPPVAHELDARFGADILLRGYELDTSALRSTGTLTLTVQWQADAPVAENYLLFAHLLDASGQRVGQTDVPPAGPSAPTATWEPGYYYTWVHPVPVQPDLPSGDYWLALGLYNPADLTRLHVAPPALPGAPEGGDNALLLPVTLP